MGKSGKGTVTSMKTKKAVAMKAVAMKAVASTTPMASSTEGHDGSTNKHPQPPKNRFLKGIVYDNGHSIPTLCLLGQPGTTADAASNYSKMLQISPLPHTRTKVLF